MRTFAIIKPEAFKNKIDGMPISKIIIDLLEYNRFQMIKAKYIKMTTEQAKEFYKEHEGKDFYDRYVNYIANKDICVMILEHEDAINAWRELMGSTDPSKARVGTIRYMFGKYDEVNRVFLSYVHGSSDKEAYERESKMFFESI